MIPGECKHCHRTFEIVDRFTICPECAKLKREDRLGIAHEPIKPTPPPVDVTVAPPDPRLVQAELDRAQERFIHRPTIFPVELAAVHNGRLDRYEATRLLAESAVNGRPYDTIKEEAV